MKLTEKVMKRQIQTLTLHNQTPGGYTVLYGTSDTDLPLPISKCNENVALIHHTHRQAVHTREPSSYLK